MTNKQPLPAGQCPHLSRVLKSLWPQLTMQEQEQFMIWAQCYSYEPYEIIYMHSDRPDCVFILAEGQVKVSQGRERIQTTRMVGPAEFFGYSNFFAETPSSMKAVAITRCTVYHFPIHGLERIIHTNPAVAMFFIRDLSSLLLGSYALTLSLTQKHVRGRLADALLNLEEKFGVRDELSGLTSVMISRADLSDICNMTQSNVTRTLKVLEEEGVLRLNGRMIQITDIRGLREVSKLG